MMEFRQNTDLPSGLEHFLVLEGYDIFGRVRYLTDEASNQDHDPYKSKYEARVLLEDMLARVHNSREGNQENTTMCIMEAMLQYHMGINYVQTEERPAGEECLKKCLEILSEDLSLAEQAAGVAISALCELGILWASRSQGAEKALSSLEQAQNLYKNFKFRVGTAPFDVNELMLSPEMRLSALEREKKFEKLYTHILFYLAQVHKNLGNSELSAKYCQRTLRRQLEAGEYDPLEWSINSACLSQYYITKNMFMQAKHCLVCSSVIVEKAKPPEGLAEPTADEGEDIKKMRSAIPQRKADIARCWVKYCLSLLEYSKEKLYDDLCGLDTLKQAQAIEELQHTADEPKNRDRMPLEVDSREEKVRHLQVTTFNEAREIFFLGKKYVDLALDFFVMDGYCTDNIELHQDMSSLYKHLIFFEQSEENKCKMHKRRIDLLSKVLGEVNPRFYLLVCRQLQFELGEIYSDMLDLKLAIANTSGANPTNHAARKINTLGLSSIRYFIEFLDTLRNLKKEFPAKFDDDVEHPAIVAKFRIARLHSKVIVPHASEKLDRLSKSLEHYTWIVDYVDRNPQCESTVQKEVELSREMKVLLPKSMERYME